MVNYSANPQSILLKRCDYFSQIQDWTAYSCVDCLTKTQFSANKLQCTSGNPVRFFDWSISKHPTQDEDESGKIYLAFKVIEWNLGDPLTLPDTATFLRNVQILLAGSNFNVTFKIDSVEMIGTFAGWTTPVPSPLPDILYSVKITPSKQLGTLTHDSVKLSVNFPPETGANNFFKPSSNPPPSTTETFRNLVI